MHYYSQYRHNGVTLVETIIGIVIITILVMGLAMYESYSLAQARTAEADMTAACTGQLELEDWKSTGGKPVGATGFDPNSNGMGFKQVGSEYQITVNSILYYLTFGTSTVATNTVSNVTLQQLTVTVRWRRDYGAGTLQSTDPTLTLTTYVY